MKKNQSRFYRVIALIMATLMVVSMLYGCKKEDTTTKGEAVTKDGNTVSSNEEENTETGNSEPTKLTIWGSWDGMADILNKQEDAPYWQAYMKATNTELKFLDTTGGADALSVLISSGDLPDIIIEYSNNIPTGVQQNLLDGTIIALNDAIDAGYMPNFKAYLEKDPEVDRLIVNDDGLYAWAPMIRAVDSPLVFGGNMIRQDWLDELGLQQPTTLQEMEDVLLAFKEKKGSTSGYSFASNYSYLVMAHGIVEGMYVDADGKVQYGCIQEGYKNFLTMFNDWYNKGILDPDGFTQNVDAFYAKIASGQTGLVFGYTGSELGKIEAMKSEYPDMDYQPIPNPVIHKGDGYPVDVSAYRVNNIGAMITSSCNNVEAAAKFLDYIYSDEGIMLSNYGQEGITYTIENGEPKLTDFVLKNPDGLSHQQALSLYAGYKNKPFITLFQVYPLEVQQKSLEVWATPDAKIKMMPPITMTSEETDEYNSIMMDINTYVNENKLKFIYGSQSIDTFNDFVAAIKKMGIDRAIELQQATYDRYISR